MQLKFGKSSSNIAPQLLDTESSQTSVYIRRNVEEKQRTNEQSGETETYFEYEEACLTKLEYQQYVNEQLTAENESLKAQLAEATDAVVELAARTEEVNAKADEAAEALIELAGMVSTMSAGE